MGLFQRVSDSIRANLNSLLDKAEDPEKMLAQYLRDMEEDIAEAEAAVAKQLAVAWKFKAQLEEALALVEKREAQAVEALQNNREDLARRALEDKRSHKAKVEEFRIQYENSSSLAEQLRNELKDMKNEYEKLQTKRDTLVARLHAAKAQKDMYGAASSLNKDSTRQGFERMEDKVLLMEAEAKLAGELGERELNRELEYLDRNTELEQELAVLKESLSGKKK